MIGFGASIQAMKAGFFDRERVLASMDRATKRALSRFGAFVRTRARTSIRKRKASSKPGEPPSSHVGLLRKWILFAMNGPDDVIIGPAKLNGTRSETALKALEHGGQTTIFRRGKLRMVTVAPRPFMRPALEKEREKAPALWAASLR